MIGSQSDRTIFLVSIMIPEGKRKHLWILSILFLHLLPLSSRKETPKRKNQKVAGSTPAKTQPQCIRDVTSCYQRTISDLLTCPVFRATSYLCIPSIRLSS